MTIRKLSKKRSKQNREYLKLRKEYLEYKMICEVKGCSREATTIHHRKGRIGDLLIDTRYFLAVCMPCHAKIELNPTWAKENGYSLSRLAID